MPKKSGSNMIILGAGLTGCIAAMYNQHATILCPTSREGLKKHKAILRFPSDRIERITGIDCKKRRITKSNECPGEPTIRECNRYSLKVTGGYYDRSILDLHPVERWIPPSNFHDIMLDILDHRIQYEAKIEDYIMDLCPDVVISTLPMAENWSLFGNAMEVLPQDVEHREIFVTRLTVERCDLWHTKYYPSDSNVAYRASIEGNLLTIESIAPVSYNDITYVTNTFGFQRNHVLTIEENFMQKIGKIVPMDETKRKDVIHRMTLDFNVYSLGRWATWRSIQLDDVANDLNVIKRMIAQGPYDMRIGK